MKLPQLTLRDLFWLVLVAGVCCAWWADRYRIAAREAALDARAKELEQQIYLQAVAQEQFTLQLEAAKQTLRAAQSLPKGRESLPVESPAHEAIINGRSVQ